MCSPVAAYAAFTIASTAYSIKTSRDKAAYEKGVANYNARVAENKAQQIRNVGVERENMIRERTARIAASQKAQLAASNVDINIGTAGQLTRDTFTLGEADAMRVRRNTELGFQSAMDQATLDKATGEYATVAGRNEQIGTILDTGTSVASRWYKPNSAAKAG